MPNPTVGPKFQDEVKDIVFDFTDDLSGTDSLQSAVVTVTVVQGTDATPSTILSGGATTSAAVATQRVSSGVRGVRYKLRAKGTAVGGTVHVQEVEMDVI